MLILNNFPLIPLIFNLGLLILNAEELVDMSGDDEVSEKESNLEGSGDHKIEDLLSENSSNNTQLFRSQITAYLSPLDISLEQFIDIDLEDAGVSENLTELSTEFQLYKHGGNSLDELNELYSKAIENLIQVAPNLHILHPVGGHFYFPSNGTLEQLEDELKFTKNGLDALTKQMQLKNLTLTDDKFDYIKYTLYLAFDEEVLNDTVYYNLLNKTFGSDPMQLVNQKLPIHTTSLFYDTNNINIKLDIVTYTELDAILEKSLIQDKRIDYKEAVGPLSELDRNNILVPKLKEQTVELLA